MPVIQDILNGPADIAAANGLESKCDSLFTNMLHYAKTHWTYVSNGQQGGQELLAGTTTAVPCGGIATALKLLFINQLGVPAPNIDYEMIGGGNLWVGPNYTCFDPLVKGNIYKLETPNVFGYGTMFILHFYLKVNGKCYDPCLSTIYNMPEQCVKMRFGTRQYIVGGDRKLLVSPDLKTAFLYMKEPVHGFMGRWAMFDCTKKNIEKAMGSQFFNQEMKISNGTLAFAKFIKTHPY